jgi:hypothetical protein
MPNGHITVSLEHKKNFSIKAREIPRELKSWGDIQDIAEDTTFQDRELVPGVHRLLQRLELEDLAKEFLDSVPDIVQSILGREDLQASHLLDLLIVVTKFNFWGVYVDVLTQRFRRGQRSVRRVQRRVQGLCRHCGTNRTTSEVPAETSRVSQIYSVQDIGLNRVLPLASSQPWLPASRKLYMAWLDETK